MGLPLESSNNISFHAKKKKIECAAAYWAMATGLIGMNALYLWTTSHDEQMQLNWAAE